jgi:uncharacterized protein YndB with AHSA1/START domain
MTTGTTASIVIDEFYPHPIERVWQAIADPAAIAQWYAETDFEPEPGRRFTFTMEPHPQWGFDGTVHCEVLEIDPPRLLRYSDQRGDPDGPWGLDTVVTFRLEPAERDGVPGTMLHFEHSGFDMEKPGGQFAHKGMGGGWQSIIRERLRRVLNRPDPAA